MINRHRILEAIGTTFINRSTRRANRAKRAGQENLNKQEFPSEMWFLKKLVEFGIQGFERNFPEGIYFIDFAFASRKIAVEIDGNSHWNAEQRFKDKVKDEFLKQVGWHVIRLNAYDENKVGSVIDFIRTAKIYPRAGYPISQQREIPKWKNHMEMVKNMTPEEKKAYRKSKREREKLRRKKNALPRR